MAWRGINMIASGVGEKLIPLFINPNIGFSPLVSTWINSVEIDKTKEGNLSDVWKMIQSNPEYIHDWLYAQKDIELHTIDYFKCNSNIVAIKDLFGIKTKTWCVFKKKDNVNSLMVVGCKTLHEQQLCEFTKKSEKHPHVSSFCPLILHALNKKFYVLNSI